MLARSNLEPLKRILDVPHGCVEGKTTPKQSPHFQDNLHFSWPLPCFFSMGFHLPHSVHPNAQTRRPLPFSPRRFGRLVGLVVRATGGAQFLPQLPPAGAAEVGTQRSWEPETERCSYSNGCARMPLGDAAFCGRLFWGGAVLVGCFGQKVSWEKLPDPVEAQPYASDVMHFCSPITCHSKGARCPTNKIVKIMGLCVLRVGLLPNRQQKDLVLQRSLFLYCRSLANDGSCQRQEKKNMCIVILPFQTCGSQSRLPGKRSLKS